MTELPADLYPRHSRYWAARHQLSLFPIPTYEFEAVTEVSRDEMGRWHKRGMLSFDPWEVRAFEERHRIEVEFVAGLVRYGLPDAWLDRLLAGLPRPYCYDPDRTFFSFRFRQWVTVPPALDPEEVVEQHLETCLAEVMEQHLESYLLEVADAEEWGRLETLRAHVDWLLSEGRGNGNGQ